MVRVAAVVALTVSATLMAPWPRARAAAPITRTVYVAARDSTGAFVTDLTAAEIVVRENRQARDVVELAPATERLHVAVLVDDGGEGGMRVPVGQFASLLFGRAAFAISVLNPQPYRLNDYSAEEGVIGPAIGRLVPRGRPQPDPMQVIEAVSWAARDQQKRELTRPVIVALVVTGEPGKTEIADDIVEDLRTSGASLHVVYAGGVSMGRVLMDGPTQSGGSHAVANNTASFGEAMIRIGRMLLRQYRLIYVLPDGVRPQPALEVTTTRPGVTMIAPTRIPSR